MACGGRGARGRLGYTDPMYGEWIKTLPVSTLYPSCLHTTLASLLSHRSSHTVPHTPLIQISTLPALFTGPPTKRSVWLVQRWATIWIENKKGWAQEFTTENTEVSLMLELLYSYWISSNPWIMRSGDHLGTWLSLHFPTAAGRGGGSLWFGK